MKKFLFFIIVILVISFSFIHFFIAPKLIQNVKSHLKDLGFNNAESQGVGYKIDGLNISKIYLDKDKFSTVKNFKLTFSWPALILNKTVLSISVDELNLVLTSKELTDRIKSFSPIKVNFSNPVSINKINIDVATTNAPIRLNGNLKSQLFEGYNNYLLNLDASQNNLSFNSKTTFRNDLQNGLYLDGIISNLNINLYDFSLKRAESWFSISANKNDFDLSAELNAGSGKIFNLPLQSINITAGKSDNYLPIIFRSKISGNETTTLSADIDFAKNIENQNFNVRFESDQFQNLLNYLSTQNIINIDSEHLVNFEKLLIEAQFLQERRFADGPWPFQFTTTNKNDKSASGVFLLYPGELNLRGSLEGNNDILKFLGYLIDHQALETNILRIDKNIKDYFEKD